MPLSDPARHSPPSAAIAASGVTSGASADAKARVRGIDLAGYESTWNSTLASAEMHWDSTYAYGELAADRQKVTNLRLPGQYEN